MRENGPAALFNERPCGGEDTFRVANNRLAMCEDNAIEVPLKDPIQQRTTLSLLETKHRPE